MPVNAFIQSPIKVIELMIYIIKPVVPVLYGYIMLCYLVLVHLTDETPYRYLSGLVYNSSCHSWYYHVIASYCCSGYLVLGVTVSSVGLGVSRGIVVVVTVVSVDVAFIIVVSRFTYCFCLLIHQQW